MKSKLYEIANFKFPANGEKFNKECAHVHAGTFRAVPASLRPLIFCGRVPFLRLM